MTNKKKTQIFQSKYGGGNVTPAQYIIELICTKKAFMSKSKQTLSHKFWSDPEWATFFKRSLRQVHKILRSYEALAVVGALNDPKSGMKWSLYSEFMINLIKEHSKRLKSENITHVVMDTGLINEQLLDRATTSHEDYIWIQDMIEKNSILIYNNTKGAKVYKLI